MLLLDFVAVESVNAATYPFTSKRHACALLMALAAGIVLANAFGLTESLVETCALNDKTGSREACLCDMWIESDSAKRLSEVGLIRWVGNDVGLASLLPHPDCVDVGRLDVVARVLHALQVLNPYVEIGAVLHDEPIQLHALWKLLAWHREIRIVHGGFGFGVVELGVGVVGGERGQVGGSGGESAMSKRVFLQRVGESGWKRFSGARDLLLRERVCFGRHGGVFGGMCRE